MSPRYPPGMTQLPTARQETFCLKWVETRSLRDAYRAAYESEGLSDKTLDKRARETFDAPVVQARIKALIDEAAAPTVFTVREALAKFLAIASADPNELIALKVGCCRYCHGEGHAYQWREREYLEALTRAEAINAVKAAKAPEEPLPSCDGGFDYDATRPPVPDCPECHGEGLARIVPRDTDALSPQGRLLYGGVKATNNGPQIIVADRMKALELATRIIGGFDDKVRVELKAMVAAVTTTTTDPNEAAKAYEQMIRGIAAT